MAPDTVALGDQIQTETRRPRTGARVVPPLLMLDEHDPPFNNGGCFKHRPDKQSSSTVPRPRAAEDEARHSAKPVSPSASHLTLGKKNSIFIFFHSYIFIINSNLKS